MLKSAVIEFRELKISRLIFGSTKLSFLWLIIRIYVGWQWLVAGYEKIINPAWVGEGSGAVIKDFITFSLTKTTGAHPDVQGWYAVFLKDVVMNHTVFFSYLVAFGEVLVGLALIFGFLTGISAFFGAYMNINYLFAGVVSVNPLLFVLQILLMLSWRIAGWFGLDRWVLPIVEKRLRHMLRIK